VGRAEGCEVWLIGGDESDFALILEWVWNRTAYMALLGCGVRQDERNICTVWDILRTRRLIH
jgi:hypothetical protein